MTMMIWQPICLIYQSSHMCCMHCRFCPGYHVAMAEMKVVLALLSRGYEFSCDTDTEWAQQVGQVPKNQLPTIFNRRAVVLGAP